MNACEAFLEAHELHDAGPATNRESLEILGALVSVLLRREIERDTLRAVDQPLDIRRLRDMAGLIADLLRMEREGEPAGREITVQFEGDTEEAAT